jgi:aminoglycoside phosphotransferase family enzyme
VYLGVQPLTVDEQGTMSIGGPGRAVDWLVVMRRLPTAELLDHRIAHAAVQPADLDAVVDLLVAYYPTAPPLPMDAADYRRHLVAQLDRDVAGLRRHGRWLDGERIDHLSARLGREIESSPAVGGRAARLVDGHGDLRPEHIVPGPPPLIIDRLSFAARFRRVDPLFDLGLLAVECDVLGAPALGQHVLDVYQERSGDRVDASLVELYQSLRGLTRARLSIAHLDDEVADPRHWVRRSERYVEVSQRHLARAG